MAAHPWRPRITYGSGPTVVNLSLPMAIWRPRLRTQGGSRIVDSGATATYRRRRDHLLATSLRVTEAEFYTAIVPFVDWCHSNGMGPYTFRPDQLVATDFTMYLESPGFTDEWSPERDEEDIGVFAVDLVHRRTTDAVINLPALL